MREARSLTSNLRNPLFVDIRGYTRASSIEQRTVLQLRVAPLQDIVGGFVPSPFTKFPCSVVRNTGAKILLPTYLGDMPSYTKAEAITLTLREDIDAFTVCADERIIKAAIDGRKEALNELRDGAEDNGLNFSGQGPAILVQVYLSHISRSDRPDCIDTILRRVERAQDAGADGVIISGQELPLVRKRFPDMFMVVGGIRPPYLRVEGDDQARSITLTEALEFGVDVPIVGRPITQAENYTQAVKGILNEIDNYQTRTQSEKGP